MMKIVTTSGKKIKINPDEIICLTMDNFSGYTKIRMPYDTFTVDETNDELLERIERA